MTITDVIIESFEDPALEGENITFSCHDGLMLVGPNSATCTRNGEWEPDPREANCTGVSCIISLCLALCIYYYSNCIIAVDRETAVMDPNGTSTLNPTSSCEDPPSMCPNTGKKLIIINCTIFRRYFSNTIGGIQGTIVILSMRSF